MPPPADEEPQADLSDVPTTNLNRHGFRRFLDDWATSIREARFCQRDLLTGWTTFFVGAIISAFLYWRNHDTKYQMAFDEYNLLNTACILGLPLVVICW